MERHAFSPICPTCGEYINMSTVSGLVKSKSRAGTGINIDGTWYNGTTAMLADVKWKENVTIEVDGENKITKVISNAPPAGGGGGGEPVGSRQNAIEWQSSRRDAITVVNAMVAGGVVTLPTAKGDKYDAYLDLINTVAMDFYKAPLPDRNDA